MINHKLVIPNADEDKYERLKTILLKHKGKENAITVKNISAMMGFRRAETQPACRKLIWETARRFNIPVIACSKGYFVAIREEEIGEYMENIQHRIDGMIQTRDMAKNNFALWQEKK